MNGIRQKGRPSESGWFYIAAFLIGGALHFADRLTIASLDGGLPSEIAVKGLCSTVLFTLNLCVYFFAIVGGSCPCGRGCFPRAGGRTSRSPR